MSRLSDFHVHPDYSIDAAGSIKEYCEKALELGLKIIVVVNKMDKPEARPEYVVDEALNLFKAGYESNLMKLRKLYEAIPQESSEEKASIRAEIKKELYDNEIDKSRVLDSTENLWKQMEGLKKKRLFNSTEEEFIGRASNPTEQQLKNFREEGRKIFREVFPDWV